MQNNVRTIVPSHNQIRTEVVTTYQQLLHAYAIRSICFMEEHGVPARHEFDGNDYQATHMIVYAGDEPVGTLRIRWFKDFAKLERTAFRAAYRNTHVLKAFAYFVFDHVARKGYDKVITHAQPKYARLSSHNQDIFRSHKTHENTSTAVDFSRTYMKQVVAIHQAMFEKLLFDEDSAVSLDLAELFHDAGRTYLQISERINETCLSQQSLQD